MFSLPGFDLQAIQRDVDKFAGEMAAIRKAVEANNILTETNNGLLERLVAMAEEKMEWNR